MRLKRFIKQYPGSSFPTLIETESGDEFVMKMRGAGNGVLSLLSEFIANKVSSSLGWAVPDTDWLYITEDFPWTFGTDEFDDIVQKSYGWNLGIEYIPNAQQLNLKESTQLHGELADMMYTLDIFFMNVDRTSASLNLLRDNYSQIWIVDHGSLALFHARQTRRQHLFPNHIFYSYKDILPKYRKELHNENLFNEVIELIPPSILEEAAFTKTELLELVRKRMQEMQH